jgi:hypothetical protein
MKHDATMGDLFAAMAARDKRAKTEADKVENLIAQIADTTMNHGLTDRAMANHLAYLSGMATTYLRAHASLLRRGEADATPLAAQG